LIQINESVKSSQEFKSASPNGDLPAVQSAKGSASGLLEVVKVIAGQNPILGSSESEKKEIDKWLQFIFKDFVPLLATPKENKCIAKFHKLNKDLSTVVFIVGNKLTVVDLALYPIFYSVVKEWKDERFDFTNVTRYFDFLQHYPGIFTFLPVIQIAKNVPSDHGTKKTKEKEPKPAPASNEAPVEAKKEKPPTVAPAEKEKPAAKESKKEERAKDPEAEKKKEERKQAREAKQVPTKAAKESETIDVSKLDIKIGKIVKIKKHESADTLYVEEIDLGESQPRTVVSGLVNFVPIEQMQDRVVVVLCNLKPANLKGVKSEAMLLAASNSDHTLVEPLDPPAGSKIGERVTFEGYTGEPVLPHLNPKQKIWETVQPDFITSNDCVATYKGVPFKTATGVIKVKTIKGGGIK